jgi:hypothetical protein
MPSTSTNKADKVRMETRGGLFYCECREAIYSCIYVIHNETDGVMHRFGYCPFHGGLAKAEVEAVKFCDYIDDFTGWLENSG